MVDVNVTVTPDTKSFQAMAEKFGGEVSKQLSNVNRAMGGGVDRDKQGAPKQNVGQQLGKLASMMPAGGMLADVGKAFKQGGMMTGVTAGVVSIVGFFKGMLSQSKIFSTVAQTFFKIVGVMLDMMLMPLLPYFMRFLQWWMGNGITWASEVGQKLAVIVPKIIGFFTTTKKVLDKILPFGTFMDWAKRFFIAWFAIWVIQKAVGAVKGIRQGGGKVLSKLRGLRGGGRLAGKGGARSMASIYGIKPAGAVKKAGMFGRMTGGLGRGLRGLGGVARGGFGLGALGRKAGSLGGGRVGRIAGRIGTRRGLSLTAGLAGRFIAKRAGGMMAGAAIGGAVGGIAGLGVGAIPGALIGAVAGLVIGQATGVAIDAATGKGFDAKRAFVPLYSETQDVQEIIYGKNEENIKKNNKIVEAAGARLNQQTEAKLGDSTKRVIQNSYIPDTMGSYIGIYEKMEDESELTKGTVETESRGLIGTIVDFFKSWPAAIMKVLGAVWGAIWGFFSDTLPGAIGTALSAIADFIGPIGSAIWSITTTVISAITGALGAAWGAILGFFTTTIPNAALAAVGAILIFVGAVWDIGATVISAITGALGVAWSAVSNFFTSTIPNAVGKVVSGIATWIAKGYDFLETVWNFITDKLGAVWGAVKKFFTETVPNAVGKVVDGVAEWIGKGFSFAETVWSCITGFLGSVWGAVKGFFTETVPNQAKAVVDKVGEWISKGFSFASTVWSCITGFLGDVWSNITTFVTETIPNTVTSVVTGVSTWISGVAGIAWSWITEKISDLATGVKDKVVDIIGSIIPDWDAQTLLSNLPGWMTKWSSYGGYSLKSFVDVIGDIAGAAGAIFTKAKDWIDDRIADLKAIVPSFGSISWSSIGTKIKDTLKNWIGKILNGLLSWIPFGLGGVVTGQIAGFFGLDPDNLSSGGVVSGQSGVTVPGTKGAPVMAMLHAGETVLPTHLGAGWMDSTKGGTAAQKLGLGGDNRTMNVMNKPTTINIYTTEDAAATIANIEQRQLMDEASFFTAV